MSVRSMQPRRMSDEELAEEQLRGIFEPPRSGLMGNIARHKLVVALCALIGAIAGIAYGVHHKPVYTAGTTIEVGTVSLSSPGFDGFVTAASSLAAVYSRAIEAEPVLRKLEHEFGLGPEAVVSHLSAEPIPDSPSFRIIATAGTPKAAISIANTTSEAVIHYEEHLAEGRSPQIALLLKEYSAATDRQANAEARVEQLTSEQTAGREADQKAGRKSSAAPGPELVKARIALSEADLRAEAVKASYQQLIVTEGGENSGGGLLSLLAPAASTTSNHSSRLKLYALVGLLLGLMLGCVAASALESAGLRRRRRSRAKDRLQATEAP